MIEQARPPRTENARIALYVVAAIWLIYTAMDLFGVSGLIHTLVKGLLMPSLLLWVLLALGARTPRLLIAGLIFATVGDVGLEYDATFIIGMAGFLAMQICYVIGFIGMGAWPKVKANPKVWAAYLIFWIAANAILGPKLGDLQLPIAVYSLALCVMATVSAGVELRIGIGGLLFLTSDMLIALNMVDITFPGRGFVVMITYVGAQYLIASGWVRRIDSQVYLPF